MQNNNELKPCPFCGGKAILDREDIFCRDCRVKLDIYEFISTGEACNYQEAVKCAVDTWNRRDGEKS